MSEVKLQAPIEVEIKVSITNGKDKTGEATIGLPMGQYVSEQAIRDRVKKFAESEMPTGFRLMTKREWFNEKFGTAIDMDDDGEPIRMNYAMPGGEAWSE